MESLAPLPSGPTTPNRQRHQALTPARFRLFPFRSPLLRESLLLSFPQGTEMFQFPRFPLSVLCVQTGVTPHDGCWVSPFGHPRIEACSAAPRGFSQPTTSFFGFRRQGIHRWLFVAWRTKMLVLAMEFSRAVDPPLPSALIHRQLRRTNQAAQPGGRAPPSAGVGERSRPKARHRGRESTQGAPSKRNRGVGLHNALAIGRPRSTTVTSCFEEPNSQ